MRIEQDQRWIEEFAETIDDLWLQALKDPGSASSAPLRKAIEKLDEASRKRKSLLKEAESLSDEILTRREVLKEQQKDLWGRSYDLQKHVTTLSAASVVGVAALVNAFQPGAELKQTATISIACLLTAIVTAVFGMAMADLEIAWVGANESPKTGRRAMSGLGWLARWASLSAFGSGFIFIGAFALNSF